MIFRYFEKIFRQEERATPPDGMQGAHRHLLLRHWCCWKFFSVGEASMQSFILLPAVFDKPYCRREEVVGDERGRGTYLARIEARPCCRLDLRTDVWKIASMSRDTAFRRRVDVNDNLTTMAGE